MDYGTTSFSVEVAFRIDPDAFIGDYADIMRHGQDANGFNYDRPGWSLGTDYRGYLMNGGILLVARMNGNGTQCIVGSTSYLNGYVHAVMTFNRSTKTLTLYVNGVSQGSHTNVSCTPSNFTQGVAIGSLNKRPAGYTPDMNSLSCPEFDIYLGRIWSGELSSTDVASLYSQWDGSGKTSIPGSVTSASPVNGWYFAEQVSSAAGAAGTGWVKDMIGTNHLKIVDTQAVTGGTQPTVYKPSGSVRIVTPASGATGVSGAVEMQAGGLMGSSGAMQYYIEVDEANTFATANLRQSGWLLADGRWRPRLKPSTTYYARVKGRQIEDGATESSWSTTISFTTRAATTWWVRPSSWPPAYGSENGTSYANAWNSLSWLGSQDGRYANQLKVEADYNSVAPGDTLTVVGDLGLMSSSSLSDIASNLPRALQVCLKGHSADYPVYLKFNDATYPARFYSFYKFTGSYNWTSEGSGVYSTTSYLTTSWIAVDSGGYPDINADSPTYDTMLYEDGTATLASPGFYYSGGKMYVKMADGLSPANKLWFLVSGQAGFRLNFVDCQYVKTLGGSFFGTSPYGCITDAESTYLHFYQAKVKYSPETEGIRLQDFCDNWTIDECVISHCRNGVYAYNTGDPSTRRTADGVTVKNSWIHHIGVTGWSDADAHCIGVQSGNDWTVTGNLLQYAGTAIEFWTSNDKEQRNGLIQDNVITDITDKATTYGAGIVLANGSHTVGLRTGFQIIDNVIMDCDGSGMQLSIGDALVVTGNLVINTGYGINDYSQCGILFGHSSRVEAIVQDNVIVNPTSRFLQIAGTPSGTGLQIDRNMYYADSPSSASESNRFQVAAYNGGGGMSFNEWVAATPFDDAGSWGDPAVAILPSGFDDAKADFFFGTLGDMDDDGDVDASDYSLLLVASPMEPRPAMERYSQLLITYGAY